MELLLAAAEQTGFERGSLDLESRVFPLDQRSCCDKVCQILLSLRSNYGQLTKSPSPIGHCFLPEPDWLRRCQAMFCFEMNQQGGRRIVAIIA